MSPEKLWHSRAAESFRQSLGGEWRAEAVKRGEEHDSTRVVNDGEGIRLLFHGQGPHRATVLLKERDKRGEWHAVMRVDRSGSVSHQPHHPGGIPLERYVKYVSLLAHAHPFITRHVSPPRATQGEFAFRRLSSD